MGGASLFMPIYVLQRHSVFNFNSNFCFLFSNFAFKFSSKQNDITNDCIFINFLFVQKEIMQITVTNAYYALRPTGGIGWNWTFFLVCVLLLSYLKKEKRRKKSSLFMRLHAIVNIRIVLHLCGQRAHLFVAFNGKINMAEIAYISTHSAKGFFSFARRKIVIIFCDDYSIMFLRRFHDSMIHGC